MDSIENIYDSLWEKSIQGFRDNIFELDNNLNSIERDNRRGITLIGRLSNETLAKAMDFLNECKLIEPNQHYYDIKDMHITILSIISCYDGFNIENIDKYAYADLVSKVLKNYSSFRILFKGITASPSCIMLQGFPCDNTLKLLRRQLRDEFKNSTLAHSIDKRYTIETAHSTIIRFKSPVLNNSSLINFLHRYRNYNFGTSEINKIEFVYNDWYMSNSLVSKIKTFYLDY